MSVTSLTIADKDEPEVTVPEEAVQSEIEAVNDLLAKALRLGDPISAFAYVRQAKVIGVLKGIGAARVLYQTWVDWPRYQQMGIDDEWENVASSQCGLSVAQCRKYRDLVADVYENPAIADWVKKALISKPIELQLVVKAAAKDGDLNDETWQDVLDAVTPAEASRIVRGIRGERTSSGTRLIIWEDRQHVLHAKQGEKNPSIVVAKLRASREDLEGNDYEHVTRSRAIAKIRDALVDVRQ